MARRAELLELAILGLLHEGPSHGYDLRRRLNTALGPFRALSYGTLYPALRGMLGRGLIAEAGSPTPGRSRGRIVYAITPAGRERFEALIGDAGADTWEDDAFGVRIQFFARTTAEVRLRILEGRRARLESELARMSEPAGAGRDHLDTWSLSLRDYGRESTEREIRWLSTLIDAERRLSPDPDH